MTNPLLLLALAGARFLNPAGVQHDEAPLLRPHLQCEMGFLAPLSHTVQFGRDGSLFDYVGEGGQDNLFKFTRFEAGVAIGRRHSVGLLYQPLDLATKVAAGRSLLIDGVRFDRDDPLDLRYGFSFWRVSYLYTLLTSGAQTVRVGASLQVRNATIDFASDGNAFVGNRDVGPVPLLKALWQLDGALGWLAVEADGFWAPIRYLNGGDTDVEGAIIDASVRAGTQWRAGIDVFVNLRYLAGGGQGSSGVDADASYTENWLQFLTLSVGFLVR